MITLSRHRHHTTPSHHIIDSNIDFPSFSSNHWSSSFDVRGCAWPLTLSLEVCAASLSDYNSDEVCTNLSIYGSHHT
jgi:hypothetical protein